MIRTWFSLRCWQTYCLLAMASLAFLLLVISRSHHRSPLFASRQAAACPCAPSPTATPAMIAKPRTSNPDWMRRHMATVAAAARAPYDVLLIGDSLTQGWEFHSKTLHALLPGMRTINAGIASDRIENILWRVENGLFAVQKPRLVILMAGINNIDGTPTPRLRHGIAQVIASIKRQAPRTQVLLLGLLPSGAKASDARRESIAAANRELRAMAISRGVSYLDFGGQLLEADGYLAPRIAFDGLHLTRSGYDIWAQAMTPTLHDLLSL